MATRGARGWRAPLKRWALDLNRLEDLEHDVVLLALGGTDSRAALDAAVEDRPRQLLLQRSPEVALERPGAERGVEALAGEPGHERGLDLELDVVLLAEPAG